jgi:hypothetical protein
MPDRDQHAEFERRHHLAEEISQAFDSFDPAEQLMVMLDRIRKQDEAIRHLCIAGIALALAVALTQYRLYQLRCAST